MFDDFALWCRATPARRFLFGLLGYLVLMGAIALLLAAALWGGR